MKRSFFQAAVTSILLYGCTTWTLTKRLEKKLDGNYIRMLRAILNKSWQQHPTRHQLYGHLPPITKTIPVRPTRHAGHCWRSRDELIRRCTLMDPHTRHAQKQDDQHERTFSSYVWGYRFVVLKTCLGRWTIGRSGERGSGISVLPARLWWWWWYIYRLRWVNCQFWIRNFAQAFYLFLVFQTRVSWALSLKKAVPWHISLLKKFRNGMLFTLEALIWRFQGVWRST